MDNNSTILENKEEPAKSKLHSFLTLLIVVTLLVIITFIALLIYDNKKYNTYKVTAADMVDFEKVYKNGVTYYKGNYKYKVGKKEYIYKSDKLYTYTPDSIIQVKYNASNPNDVYNENDSKMFFIILISSIGVFILLVILKIAVSPSKVQEIVVVQVIEKVNCVGGQRIYLSNINIPKTDPNYSTLKYFVYFSSNKEKFKVGNLLQFNIYKYGEGLTSEKYRSVYARTIYNFKDDDFIIYNPNKNNELQK